MRIQHKDYIIKNSIDSISGIGDLVESFCDYFDLKVKWSGLIATNATFSKCVKELESNGLIQYAFKCKIDRGWGAKGGNVKYYKFTEKGYIYRAKLRGRE